MRFGKRDKTVRYLGNKIVVAALLVAASMAAVSSWATEDYGIVGVWNSEDKDARIEIFNCADKVCGKIVWMDEPYYTVKDKEGKPGDLKLDIRNPDPSLRPRTILGLQILNDFTFAGGNRWTGGKVYDPKTGNTYSGAMSLVTNNKLYLRGFVGFSLFGRTTTWTRADNETK